MQLYNIGGEGQFYWGAIAAVGIALYLGDKGVDSTPVLVIAMSVAGALAGASWAAIPAVLRAFARTNEIITSLMLNYVAGLVLTYLIIDSRSYWRDLESFEGQTFPLGKSIPEEANWPGAALDVFGGILVPLGFGVAVAVAVVIGAVYSRTRFGYELQVIGDSQRTARFAGMRLRRKILAVMCISGAVAGLGGASYEGDFAYQIDPTGLQTSFFGYTGIVVAALAAYNPLAVVPVGFLLGGVLNAGFTLQGADFPSGLVGVMQGLILFCALGGEVLVRYRVRFGGTAAPATAPAEGGAS
jgi:simple sugar transport system permease protein